MDSGIMMIRRLSLRSEIRNDDSVDQLHHYVTVTILVIFAVASSCVELAGETVNCWDYGKYRRSHYHEHVNQFCRSSILYHYPNLTDRSVMPYILFGATGGPIIPPDDVNGGSGRPAFSKWLTVVFFAQAFMFKLPNMLWTEINTRTGIDIGHLVTMLNEVVFAKPGEKRERMRQLALFIEQWLFMHRLPAFSDQPGKTLTAASLGAFLAKAVRLSNIYLLTKLLYLLNILLQFYLLSSVLQVNFWHFGISTIHRYAYGHWSRSYSQVFPAVALCNFRTLTDTETGVQLADADRWVQCILTVNVWLEKMFLMEWCWMLALLLLTIISLSRWCLKFLQTSQTVRSVYRYIEPAETQSALGPALDLRSVTRFVEHHLGNDGVLIVLILALNADQVVVAELVKELWRRHKDTCATVQHPTATRSARGDDDLRR